MWDNNVCWASENSVLVCDTSFARIQDPKLVQNEYGISFPTMDFASFGADKSILGGKYGRPLTGKDVGPEWMDGKPGWIERIADIQQIPEYKKK